MNFTDWKIDTLRRALNNYRTVKARNGQLLSWDAVVDHILLCKAVPHAPPSDDDPEMKAEALRRFANGKSVLHPHKLVQVKAFLIDAGILTEDDLIEDNEGLIEAMAVHGYLANDTEEAKRHLSKLLSSYYATRATSQISDRVELNIQLERSGSLMRVEERFQQNVEQESFSSPVTKKDNFLKATEIRRGYGFVATRFNILHIFLRGAAMTDRIHYIQLHPLKLPVMSRNIFLARVGAIPSHDKSNDPNATMQNCNIYQFQPMHDTAVSGYQRKYSLWGKRRRQ